MLQAPILLIGGSGIVGRWAACFLHDAHPGVPLLLGGRDLAKAQEVAAGINGAEGIAVNLTADDLGLGQRPVSAVAVLFTDDRRAGLRFAQARGVPHLSISPGIFEMGPEVAAYIHNPQAAPVVLGTEWLVGATTIPTLEFAKAFGRVHEITIGALLDEQDAAGPAAYADLERQTKTMPAALVRRDEAFAWRVGDEAKATFRAVDGTEQEAVAFSVYDVLGLATVTGAPNVQFKLALGVSSTRRQGEPVSTEIIIELAGEDHAGQPLRTRHAVVHPQGQMPLTGLGVAMLLERLLGLDGQPAVKAGLYFPYQLLEPGAYLARLRQIGGRVLTLEVPQEQDDRDPPASTDPFPVRRAQVQANGALFHVLEQGEGPAVLFCHGFPDTAETWRRQMRAVAEAGYRAVALDMRGFGASYAPSDAAQYSALHTVGDLVGVLDALRIESAILVGHDWGADVAQRAMVMRPDRFRAIVSLSIPFSPRGEISTWDELRRQGLGDRYYAFDMMKPNAEALFEPAEKTIPRVLYWLSGSPPPGTGWDPTDPARHMLQPLLGELPSWADPEYVRHTIRSFSETGFRGGLNYYRAAQATFDLMPAFKDVLIEQPALYIWGAADGLCQLFHPTPPTLEELRRVAPGLIDVVCLENVGHWPQHEAADRVNAELLKFLDSLNIKSPLASHRPAPGTGTGGAIALPVNPRTELTLEAAIRAGDLAAALEQLRAGADVNQAGPEGLTPLMIAAGLGQAQLVELLLTADAQVHAIDPRMGATALQKAVQSGNADVAGLLLDHGAFIDQQSPVLGNTPLMDAVLHKHEAVVRLLLQRGARTTIRNHWQQSALELAQQDGLDTIARLLEAQNEKNAGQVRAMTLTAAIKAGNTDEVKQLLEAGAPLNERLPMVGSVDDDYTPLGLAAREGHADIVQLLLAAGADPRQVVGLMGGTPVHEASYFGYADIIRMLMEKPMRIDGPTAELDAQGAYNGYTALHDAVWHGHLEAARALVEAGARLDVKSHAGLTPHGLALRYGYDELAQFLAEAGRK